MIQNFITNFVNMLDNIMVGNVGTVQMNGVAVSNQLLFVFNLCIFGAVSGVGIFTAQFYGKGDTKGVRDTFRFKLIVCGLIALLGIVFFWFFGDNLIGLYLRGEGKPADAAASLLYGEQYLKIMLIGIIPYALVQCYSGTLRETGESVVPMAAGIAAVLVNLGLNALLIFGLCGFPRLGSNGAAIATVISRFVELAVVAIWTRATAKKHPFILGAYRSLRIPRGLIRPVLQKGMPLMLNEALWASGMA
ncbi:MAG: polysaccharide biosynthesis C-terminal domain-containing protein, partial [Clostridia bacterium]|nr:polysaccharide biosynthesis C-terminal domain-containing protein [Clostridia bacterium]